MMYDEKTNPTFCKLQEEATWSLTEVESGPAAFLFHPHSLSCLCEITSTSNWPSVTLHIGARYLQPCRPFTSPSCFPQKVIVLLCFTAAQSAPCSTQLFLASYQLVRLFFQIRQKKKKRERKKAHRPWSRVWLCMTMNPCRYPLILIKSFAWFVFYLLMENECIIFPPTQSLKHSGAQQGDQGTWSFVCSQRKVILNDWLFYFFYIKDALK